MNKNIDEKKFVYEYDEDSILLEECFKKEYKTTTITTTQDYSLLEVGFGNGILLEKIYTKKEYEKIKTIYGTEINKYAYELLKEKISYIKKQIKENKKKKEENKEEKKIILKNVEYNKDIKQKFDFILFNPPYLPESKEDKYLTEEEKKAFIGGKKGIETTINFLKKIKENLKENTKIFIIASSHSDIKLLEHTIKYEGYNIIKKEEKKLPFEKLYCYILEPNLALKYAIKKNYTLEYYDKGKRSIVYLIKKTKEKKVEEKIIKYALKEKNTNLKKEKEILQLLSKKHYGKKILVPKVYDYKEEGEEKILVLQYIEGISAKETQYLGKKTKKVQKELYKKLLEYSILLDLLKLKKQEFTRPYSNVIISKNKVFLIDFERTQKNKTGNLNQLLDYYRKNNMIKIKEIKKITEEYNKELKKILEEKNDLQKKEFLKKWYLKITKMLKL